MGKIEYKEDIRKSNSPFTFDVKKAVGKAKESKRTKDGIILIDKNDIEGKEWYLNG